MKESGYYAPGTEFRSDAPWNQTDPDALKFDIEITTTLSRSATIESTDYSGGCFIKEEKIYEPAEYTGNALAEFKEQCYGIKDLLAVLSNYLVADINKETDKDKKQKLDYILQECISWIEGEETTEES